MVCSRSGVETRARETEGVRLRRRSVIGSSGMRPGMRPPFGSRRSRKPERAYGCQRHNQPLKRATPVVGIDAKNQLNPVVPGERDNEENRATASQAALNPKASLHAFSFWLCSNFGCALRASACARVLVSSIDTGAGDGIRTPASVTPARPTATITGSADEPEQVPAGAQRLPPPPLSLVAEEKRPTSIRCLLLLTKTKTNSANGLLSCIVAARRIEIVP